jgi:hypothetical protein
MADRRPMPNRDEVDPQFDGHLERPLLSMTISERLDWIWEAMQLLHLGEQSRRSKPSSDER